MEVRGAKGVGVGNRWNQQPGTAGTSSGSGKAPGQAWAASEPPRGLALGHPDPGLLPPGLRINPCCVTHPPPRPVCGNLLWQPQETNMSTYPKRCHRQNHCHRCSQMSWALTVPGTIPGPLCGSLGLRALFSACACSSDYSEFSKPRASAPRQCNFWLLVNLF